MLSRGKSRKSAKYSISSIRNFTDKFLFDVPWSGKYLNNGLEDGGRGGLKHVRLEMLWCLTPPLLLSQAFTCKSCSPDQIEENRSRSTPVLPSPPLLLRPLTSPRTAPPPSTFSSYVPFVPTLSSPPSYRLRPPPTDSAPPTTDFAHLRHLHPPSTPSTPPFSAPITPPPPPTFVPLHPILPTPLHFKKG
jgi:hypothetical protein